MSFGNSIIWFRCEYKLEEKQSMFLDIRIAVVFLIFSILFVCFSIISGSASFFQLSSDSFLGPKDKKMEIIIIN